MHIKQTFHWTDVSQGEWSQKIVLEFHSVAQLLSVSTAFPMLNH